MKMKAPVRSEAAPLLHRLRCSCRLTWRSSTPLWRQEAKFWCPACVANVVVCVVKLLFVLLNCCLFC